MTLSDWRGSRQIFLSHSGRDKDLADRLSFEIRTAFFEQGRSVSVFNTSDPSYRFSNWKDLSTAVSVSRTAVARQEKKLRAYLRDNLAVSSAYFLLVTRDSIATGSDWVRWEIQEGTALARSHDIPFVPVLVNRIPFPRGDLLGEAAAFQSIELDLTKPEELRMKLYRLVHGFLSNPNWRRAFEEGPESRRD